jgi:plastocyanin
MFTATDLSVHSNKDDDRNKAGVATTCSQRGNSSMRIRSIVAGLCLVFSLLVFSLGAENIEGTVVIRKQLTKRRVTAAVPLYERGPGASLAADNEEDPLAAERARVAVWLEGSGLKSALARTDAKIEQKDRRFIPEIIVISAGAKVSFPNLDPIFHNVFSLSKVRAFDLGNYPRGETRTVTFPTAGIVYLNCHLHSNMAATIVVTPNQWNTMGDRAGKFALHDVPPGEYTLVAWHKTAGFFRQPVRLAAGQDVKTEFLIPLNADGSRLRPDR